MKTQETFAEKVKRAFIVIQDITIPEIPEHIMAINRELSERYPNNVKIADIIGQNAMLAAELLHLVNATMMRPPHKITSINHALSILGSEKLKNMITSIGLKQVFGNTTGLREIMEDAVDVGICAAELANLVHGVSTDEAYTCGLFHNCGAILLMIKSPEEYHDLFYKSYSNPLGIIEQEEDFFATNHTVTGLILAKKWQLDDSLISAIYLHHTTSCADIGNEKVRLLVALLKVASGIVSDISLGRFVSEEMKSYMQDGMNTLMITSEQLQDARIALHSRQIGL